MTCGFAVAWDLIADELKIESPLLFSGVMRELDEAVGNAFIVDVGSTGLMIDDSCNTTGGSVDSMLDTDDSVDAFGIGFTVASNELSGIAAFVTLFAAADFRVVADFVAFEDGALVDEVGAFFRVIIVEFAGASIGSAMITSGKIFRGRPLFFKASADMMNFCFLQLYAENRIWKMEGGLQVEYLMLDIRGDAFAGFDKDMARLNLFYFAGKTNKSKQQ